MSDGDTESAILFDNMDSSENPLLEHKLPMARPQRRSSRSKNRFKRKRKLVQCLMTTAVFLIVLGVTATLIYIIKTTTTYDTQIPDTSIQQYILLWSNNPSWGISSKEPTQQDLRNIPLACGIPNCFIDIHSNSNHQRLETYNVTVVTPSDDIFEVLQHQNWSKEQFMVFANKDQVMNTTKNIDPILAKFYQMFTYRTDSDFIWNHFEVVRKSGIQIAPSQDPPWEDRNFIHKMDFKVKKQLAQSVANRTNFAIIRICDNTTISALVYDELKNYILPPTVIDVDYNCQTSNPYEISSSLKNYKFLLAFEDALCTDYISKLFYTALQNQVIPVVLGGPINYNNFAPPYSYIVGQNFTSIRELAEYLIHLDESPMDYVEYLWWTNLYTVQLAPPPLCQLCRHIQFTGAVSPRGRNERLYWWNKNQCDNTTSLLSNR